MDTYTSVYQYGKQFLVRGFDGDGRRFSRRDSSYRPYLFLRDPAHTGTGFRTLAGTPLRKVEYDSPYEARQAARRFDGVGGPSPFYGMDQFVYPYISDNFDLVADDVDLSHIRVATIDIETTARNGFPDINNPVDSVTAITLMYKSKTYFFSYKRYEPADSSVKTILCEDERDLLAKFVKLWSSERFSPDVVTGWYVKFFDIPYLVNRITALLGKEYARRLSPWRLLKESRVFVHGRENTVYSPIGVAVLDYMDLYKKFTFKARESYSLDFICELELGEKKLDYSDFDSLDDLYERDFQRYADYNVHDCRLINKLDEKLNLLELAFTVAYSSGVNFEDVFGSIRVWDVIIYNYLIRRGVVVPMKRPVDEGAVLKPVGGYVKPPATGLYDWIVSFDLTSLYPHLIMGYNISPETKLAPLAPAVFNDPEALERVLPEARERLVSDNVCVAANGVTYDRSRKGFLPQLMEDFFARRKRYRDELKRAKREGADENLKRKLDVFQLAIKILLNSAYGALAKVYFRWFDYDLAQSITFSGQMVIKYTERSLNRLFNERFSPTEPKDYVVAMDTDSVIVDFRDFVETLDTTDPQEVTDEISDFCERELSPFFESIYQDLAERTNAYRQALHMKREKICDRAIFFVKKNYALSIMDDEGERFRDPEVTIKGGVAVKSSTPKVCREALKRCVEIILRGSEEDLVDYVRRFREDFVSRPYEDIAFISSVSELTKYESKRSVYKKGTPIHVKASLLYNKILRDRKISKEPVYDGDKVKYIYLKLPNPIGENVVAFKDPRVLSLLGIGEYVDYDTQLRKSFLKPLDSICDVAGLDYERVNRVHSFFEE